MMKRLSALFSLALLTAVPAFADSATITVDAGLLTSHTGAVLPDGSLVLVIASQSGVFTPTVGSQFVSGDNLILGLSSGSVSGALGLNSAASGTPGETLNEFTFNLGVGATGTSTLTAPSIVAGDKIAIRWYDNFTLAQFQAGLTPTSGDYGTYTTLLNTTPDGGQAWVIPSNGSVALNFFTLSDFDGATQPNIEGQALTPVASGSVAVPEPSTYALLAMGLFFLAGFAAKRKRLVTVAK